MINIYHGTSLEKVSEIASSGAVKSPYQILRGTILKWLVSTNKTKEEFEAEMGGKSIDEIVLSSKKTKHADREFEIRVKRYSVTININQAANYTTENGIVLGFGISRKELQERYFEGLKDIYGPSEVITLQKRFNNTKISEIPNHFRTMYFRDDLSLDKLKEIHLTPQAFKVIDKLNILFSAYHPTYKMLPSK